MFVYAPTFVTFTAVYEDSCWVMGYAPYDSRNPDRNPDSHLTACLRIFFFAPDE